MRIGGTTLTARHHDVLSSTKRRKRYCALPLSYDKRSNAIGILAFFVKKKKNRTFLHVHIYKRIDDVAFHVAFISFFGQTTPNPRAFDPRLRGVPTTGDVANETFSIRRDGGGGGFSYAAPVPLIGRRYRRDGTVRENR